MPNPAPPARNPVTKRTEAVASAEGLEISTALRRYLYFTAAMTGASIMVVQILGAKMLSPYMGTSHFVWTAQIAVTMIALACGYYVGGRLADYSRNLKWLYWSILGAACYLGMTVLITRPVAYWCLNFRLEIGSLLASGILFFLPLAALAMTGPFVVRIITASVSRVGGNMGRLTSVSTLGSLLGTILIAYFLVPWLPNSLSMYATGLGLVLVCVGYFAAFHRKGLPPFLVAAIVGLGFPALGLGKTLHPDFQWMKELHRRNSHFGMLQVLQREDGTLFLLDDNLIQNTYDPARGQSVSHFTYMLSGLARVYTPRIDDVLCIGLGAGIVPMEFAREGARVDVAEINPSILPVATEFFGVDPTKFNLFIGDGRQFLNRCTRQYDVVVLDVFLGDSSPSHLLTREAFASIRKVLRPEGVLVINSFAQLGENKDFFAASLAKTLAVVFPSVRMHTSGRGEMFYVAGNRQELTFLHSPDTSQVHPQVRRYAEAAYQNVVQAPEHSGRVLRDDYNPAEFFDARNREEYRKTMAFAVKNM